MIFTQNLFSDGDLSLSVHASNAWHSWPIKLISLSLFDNFDLFKFATVDLELSVLDKKRSSRYVSRRDNPEDEAILINVPKNGQYSDQPMLHVWASSLKMWKNEKFNILFHLIIINYYEEIKEGKGICMMQMNIHTEEVYI